MKTSMWNCLCILFEPNKMTCSFKRGPALLAIRMRSVVLSHVSAWFRSPTASTVWWVSVRCFPGVCVSLMDKQPFRLYTGTETRLWELPGSTARRKIQSLPVLGDTTRPWALRCRKRPIQLQLRINISYSLLCRFRFI